VIDAGSCICLDYIDNKANYKGGSISLGFQMKSKALNTFTARLPLVEINENKVSVCSLNTFDCIKSGIINGTIAEIRGMIDMISKEQDSEFKIIVTGGDANLLSENLNIQAFVEPNLVLQGLNTILDYNIKKRDA
jgi:type III pantothenate kinase